MVFDSFGKSSSGNGEELNAFLSETDYEPFYKNTRSFWKGATTIRELGFRDRARYRKTTCLARRVGLMSDKL